MRANNSVEIDLLQCARDIWSKRWWIGAGTVIVAIMSAAFLMSLPNVYRSETSLQPIKEQSELGGVQALASQFGGLASLAGMNLQRDGDEAAMALAILSSRDFILNFIKENRLEVELIASKGWDHQTRELLIDDNIYDAHVNEWKIEGDDGVTREPTDTELYEAFKDIYSVKQSIETGLVSISIESYSPATSMNWLHGIIEKINSYMKGIALQESEIKIEYLEKRIRDTSLISVHSVFSQLIENELQKKMLADTRVQYIFKTIDPPFIPDEKIKPLRGLILVLSTFASTILFCFIALIDAAIRRAGS